MIQWSQNCCKEVPDDDPYREKRQTPQHLSAFRLAGPLVGIPLDCLVLKHARWIHRAIFLSRLVLPDAAAAYLRTVRGDYPYRTLLAGVPVDGIVDRLEETGGLADSVSREEFLAQLCSALTTDSLEHLGPADPLRELLPGGSNGLWRDEYCALCSRGNCPADSIERDRCARLAFIIGAWDPVETRDIYLLYRQDSESLRQVYARIARHENLDSVLDTARPRWPDAF